MATKGSKGRACRDETGNIRNATRNTTTGEGRAKPSGNRVRPAGVELPLEMIRIRSTFRRGAAKVLANQAGRQ